LLLVFYQPSEPIILWKTFRTDFCQDILHREQNRLNNYELTFSEEIFNQGLIEIEDKVVCLSEKYLHEFGLTSPIRDNQNFNDPYNSLFRRPYNIHELNNCVVVNLPKLVDDQRYSFNVIIDSVINNRCKVFFVDVPGGTGKTFLINLLLAKEIGRRYSTGCNILWYCSDVSQWRQDCSLDFQITIECIL